LARCPVCKKEQVNYEWKRTKNGKSWLYNDKTSEWHNCPKSVKNTEFQGGGSLNGKLTRDDFVICILCGHAIHTDAVLKKFPTIQVNHNLASHLKTFHPNGEILDAVDFMCLHEAEKEKFRIKNSIPKRTTPYMIHGIFVK